MMRNCKNRKGFSLIELLVVIAIIGLLTTLAIVVLSSARGKARDARRLSDVKQIMTALEVYRVTEGEYPSNSSSMVLNLSGDLVLSGQIALEDGTIMMNPIPRPPLPRDGICLDFDLLDGEAGTYYMVEFDNSEALGIEDYYIIYCLGAETQGLLPGIHLASPRGISTFHTDNINFSP